MGGVGDQNCRKTAYRIMLAVSVTEREGERERERGLSLIHISEPTRPP